MATTTSGTRERTDGSDPKTKQEPETSQLPARRQPAAGRWIWRVVIALLVIALPVAGVTLFSGALDSDEVGPMLTHAVASGELVVTVTEDGNVESARNQDIKCDVAGGSTIIEIVPDGTVAKAGDVLVRLDSSALDEQINAQKITYERARATMIQAQKDFEVAKIAVKEYVEGNYRQELQTLEANVTIAMENLRSAQNMLQHTQKMFRKGYVSPLQRETQQFAVERAQLELDSANTAKDVLERFTKAKTVEQLESARDTAEAQMLSEKASFDLEESKLRRLEGQLDKCVIVAPQDGMVVYANDMGKMRYGGQQGSQIEEGATVRERQSILKLPDLNSMQVKVNVHESRVDQIRRGLRARIRIQDREFQGTVTSISNQPEATNFFAANVKEYSTIVTIDGTPDGLRPGMTAEVEILVDHLKDVLTLPVAAVVEQGGDFLCWARTPSGIERRPLVLGVSNQQFVAVDDGVALGDQVVLNPRAMIEEARGESFDAAKLDVQERFGSSAKPDAGAGKGPQESGKSATGTIGKDPSTMPSKGAAGAAPGDAGQRGGRGGGGAGRSFDLMQYDADKDGKVSRDEAPEQMKSFFDRLDGNGDGFIDSAEIDAMRERFRQRGGGGQGGSTTPASGAAGPA